MLWSGMSLIVEDSILGRGKKEGPILAISPVGGSRKMVVLGGCCWFGRRVDCWDWSDVEVSMKEGESCWGCCCCCCCC